MLMKNGFVAFHEGEGFGESVWGRDLWGVANSLLVEADLF